MSDEEMLECLEEMIEDIIKEHKYDADEVTFKRVKALRKAHYLLSHRDENSEIWTVESIKKLEES